MDTVVPCNSPGIVREALDTGLCIKCLLRPSGLARRRSSAREKPPDTAPAQPQAQAAR